MKAMHLSLPLAVLAIAASSLALPIAGPQAPPSAPAAPVPPAAPALPPALPAGLPPAFPAAPAPVPAPPAFPSPPASLNQAAPPTAPPSTGNQKTALPPSTKKSKNRKMLSRRDLGADAVPVDANSAVESASGAVGTVSGVAGMVASTVNKNGRRGINVAPAVNHAAGTINYVASGRRSIKFNNHHGSGSAFVGRDLSPFGRLPIVDDVAPMQPVKNIPVEAIAYHAGDATPTSVPVSQPIVEDAGVPNVVGAILLAGIKK